MKEKIFHADYLCTWNLQAVACEEQGKVQEDGEISFIGDQGASTTREAITEHTVFGKNGWINLFPEDRQDLFFLLDDGWDVEYLKDYGKEMYKFGSHDVNEKKFPSFKGTPTEKLKQFVERVKAAGWKGLGIWLPMQAYGEELYHKSVRQTEGYWREMLERSKEAGVSYWKVDWGHCAYNTVDRGELSKIAKEVYPELIIEHGICCDGVNDKKGDGSGRYVNDESYNRAMAYIKYPDILRTYDMSALGICTTMDRVAALLPESEVLLNCESIGAMAAGLGFSMGIMGTGLSELAAVRWHRIAPAFSGGTAHISDELLYDAYHFRKGSHWDPYLIDKTIGQAAPAVISRNTELPKVECNGEPHFVVASLNPTGAYSVATLNRQLMGATSNAPEIICFVDNAPSDIGMFGDIKRAEFKLSAAPKKVVAENIITRETEDITEKAVSGESVIITDELLKEIFGESESTLVGNRLKIEY